MLLLLFRGMISGDEDSLRKEGSMIGNIDNDKFSLRESCLSSGWRVKESDCFRLLEDEKEREA
jgi:hypothetical protein